jgi:peptidoglycan/LPS O-acetylase OafA/YrhL
MAETISQAGEVRSARIESLRALAALAVLGSHAFGYAHNWKGVYSTLPDRLLLGGGSGVLVFFALSGYLLFWPFAKRWFGQGNQIDLRRYALNRVLRILPLYYVAVIVFLVVSEHGGSFSQWWRFGLLFENFSTQTLTKVDGPLWSVIVEIHFYALLPLIAVALAFVARRRRAVAIMLLLAVGLVGALFRDWALTQDWHTASLLQYSLPGTFYFFVPGMLLALLRLEVQEHSWRLPGPAIWLLASVPFWLWHFNSVRDWPAAIASFLVVAACVLPLREDRAVRALEWRPLAVLGIASYSIYVWHMPIVKALDGALGWSFAPLLAVSLLVCCAVALASYRFIEAPFLALRTRWSGTEADRPRVPLLSRA